MRACDADRERVIDVLKTSFVQGRLTCEELSDRVGQALAARTYADLVPVTADIPDMPALMPKVPASRRARSGRDKTAAVWVAALMVIAPALTGALLTFYGGFVILLVIAFIGVTVTAQP